MAEIFDLDTTDANNNGTAANAGFPENMDYDEVNNAARALEGMLARWYADTNGTLQTAGSANTYTLTPNRTIGAYQNGLTFMVECHADNTDQSTINVSGLGAKSLVKTLNKDPLRGGEFQNQGRYWITYDGTDFILLNPTVQSGGYQRKGADESVSNTTLQDDNHFTDYQILANSLYQVEGQIAVAGSSGGNDVKMAFSFAQTPQTAYFDAATILNAGSQQADAWTGGNEGALTLDTDGTNIIRINGIILSHASVDGTLKLQWAENTDTGTITFKAGSWLRVTEVSQ